MIRPLAILPKFLWNDIYLYLDYPSHFKLLHAHLQFIMVKADSYYKEIFLEHRRSTMAIVPVHDINTRIRYFWLYALIVYSQCASMTYIYSVIKNIQTKYNTSQIKVFIKAGVYDESFYSRLSLDKIKYIFNIELIGSTTGTTQFGIVNPHYTYHQCCISISSSVSIKNITFYNVDCRINGRMCLDYTPNITISNCCFLNNYATYNDCAHLHILDTKNIVISNTQFINSTYTIKDAIYIVGNSKYISDVKSYSISKSKFTNTRICCELIVGDDICFVFNNNLICKSEKVIKLSPSMFYYNSHAVIGDGTTILVKNNCINNVKTIIDNFEQSTVPVNVTDDNCFIDVDDPNYKNKSQ